MMPWHVEKYIPCLDLSVAFRDFVKEIDLLLGVDRPWMKQNVCGKNKKEHGVCFVDMDSPSTFWQYYGMPKNVKPHFGRIFIIIYNVVW